MLKFTPGRFVATPGALRVIEENHIDTLALLARHLRGDWGDLGDDDKAANDQSVIDGTRILSAYNVGDVRLWIITEGDRSSTCVLLPAEY